MTREEEIRREITAFLSDDTSDSPNFTLGDVRYLLEKIDDIRAILLRAQKAQS